MSEEDELIETVKRHDERILDLEEADKKHTESIREVKASYISLENTILNENRSMRTFFENSMNKQWDIIIGKSQFEDAKHQRDHDLSKTKLERYSEITLKIVGAGGLLIIVAQALLQ